MNIHEILKYAVDENASDIFIVAGTPVSVRKNGTIKQINDTRVLPDDAEHLIKEIYALSNERNIDILNNNGDDDFSFSIQGLSRFRANTFIQRGSYSAVIRIVTFELPDPEQINIPKNIIDLANNKNGMILITGAAGTGKSTTLACIIDHINRTRKNHIITLEDPLEYLHRHNQSIVSQREIHTDTENYVTALRSALRQSPDVILLGEMRDYETINVALTAAETGHLLFSTLHTTGASNTIERIIDVFPANQQHQIAVQLSMVLTAIVSQQLVPGIDGSMVPAFEIMTVNPAIRNLIRDNKIPQIEGILYSSNNENMMSMDASLLKLYKDNKISDKTALMYATNPDMLKKKM